MAKLAIGFHRHLPATAGWSAPATRCQTGATSSNPAQARPTGFLRAAMPPARKCAKPTGVDQKALQTLFFKKSAIGVGQNHTVLTADCGLSAKQLVMRYLILASAPSKKSALAIRQRTGKERIVRVKKTKAEHVHKKPATLIPPDGERHLIL